MIDAASTLALDGAALPKPTKAPRDPAGQSPSRRPGSVRRTSSLYVDWPDGRDAPARLRGRARDIVTPWDSAAPVTIAEDQMTASSRHRVISDVVAAPHRYGLERLDGARAGGHLRAAIDHVLREERIAGTPLYLLLDDMAGTTLIAGWAWTQWGNPAAIAEQEKVRSERVPEMEGVCIGFRPGSSALDVTVKDGNLVDQVSVPPIERADDPEGWHSFPAGDGANMRRVRRIDVWRESDHIAINATFQDSAALPEGGRRGLHEYVINAKADLEGQTLKELSADPHILPYPECPAAIVNLSALLSTPLADMRGTVLRALRKTAGCTHLNDALRALAEVPRLIGYLPDR